MANRRRKRRRDTLKRYLRSPRWKQKRKAALKHYGRACCRCGSEHKPHVRHRNFERTGRERISDLEVVCEDCFRAIRDGQEMRANELDERFQALVQNF